MLHAAERAPILERLQCHACTDPLRFHPSQPTPLQPSAVTPAQARGNRLTRPSAAGVAVRAREHPQPW